MPLPPGACATHRGGTPPRHSQPQRPIAPMQPPLPPRKSQPELPCGTPPRQSQPQRPIPPITLNPKPIQDPTRPKLGYVSETPGSKITFKVDTQMYAHSPGEEAKTVRARVGAGQKGG
eukprot:351840-Chlamydomonas_euryale.AAC.7